MEDNKVVTGEDWNRLFDDYLSHLNDRITKLEREVAEWKKSKN